MTRFILVGLSPRAPEHHRTLDRLAAGRTPAGRVAYLQLADPSLTAALDDLNATGPAPVTLVPTDLENARPATSWLGRVAAHWLRHIPEPPPLTIAPATLTEPDPDRLDHLLTTPGRAVRPTAAPLNSPAWETVPGYRHHVLVCRGPRCSAQGADTVTDALTDRLNHHGLGDDDALLTTTGCLFPCNHAPVITVHPDDAWYGHLTPDTAATIVDEHLVGDRPVERHRLPRRPER